MPELNFGDINIWAALTAGVVAFLIGGVWYTALFGKRRVALLGWTDEKVQEVQTKTPPPVFFGVLLACYMLMATAFSVIAALVGVTDVSGGVFLAVVLWVGLALPLSMTTQIASDQPFGVYRIDAAFFLVFLIAIGAIVGVWR